MVPFRGFFRLAHRLSQEVKNMRQRKLPARISQRLGAALLAGVTLWDCQRDRWQYGCGQARGRR